MTYAIIGDKYLGSISADTEEEAYTRAKELFPDCSVYLEEESPNTPEIIRRIKYK